MNRTVTDGTNETIPLRSGGRTSTYLPVAAVGRTFGTSYFLCLTIVSAIIPILQLAFGLSHKGQCPIDQRIPTYMIVAGICGLVLVGLSIFLAMYFITDSTALNLVASCGICLNVLTTFLISIFVFIWFILGCVWVFGVYKQVQYIDPTKSTYCQPTLYKWTFALLVITIIWACLQCCMSCFRQCCTIQRNE